MRDNGSKEGAMFQVGESMRLGCLSYDTRDRGIVNVAYIGKQMVFDLEIKAPKEIIYRAAPDGKVAGRMHLQFRPRHIN